MARSGALEEDEETTAMPTTRGSRPDPDPTLRTLQLVDKAVDSLRVELETRFKAVDIRFQNIDQATKLVHDDYVRVPTLLDKAVSALRELLEAKLNAHDSLISLLRTAIDHDVEYLIKGIKEEGIKLQVSHADLSGRINQIIGETNEKFQGVAAQFAERDTRTDQRAGDTKLAVDAAFAAAKEATAKIEAGFTKQIDAMISIIDTKTGNLAEAISDVKDRLTAIESRSGVVDPSIRNDLATVMAEVRSLRDSERTIRGASNQSADSTARTWAIVAIAVAALVGVAQVLTRLH